MIQTYRKAQLSLVLILVAVLALGLIILIFMAGEQYIQVGDRLEDTSNAAALESKLAGYVKSCMVLKAIPVIDNVTWHGGTLHPESSLYVQKEQVTAWCVLSQNGCENVLLTRQDMEEELQREILARMEQCLDFGAIQKEVDSISVGAKRLKVTIAMDSILLNLEMPVRLTKASTIVDMDSFSSSIQSPLSKLYDSAVWILNNELSNGLDKEQIMLALGSNYHIKKHNPYPNTVWSITKIDRVAKKNISFNFGIEGKSTVGIEVFQSISSNGCCTFDDGTCMKGASQSACIAKNARYSPSPCFCDSPRLQAVGCCTNSLNECSIMPQDECTAPSAFDLSDPACQKVACTNLNCPSTYDYKTGLLSQSPKKNGESWCVYEDRPGYARDFVGTRHYKHSCLFGMEFVEECRDYREELCTQENMILGGRIVSQGDCRVNRWQDCYTQENKEACEDISKRDCYWFGGDKLYLDEEEQSVCVPFVSPGFRFWEGGGQQVCNAGSQKKNDIAKDWPRTWSYSTFFVCQRLGDCGDKRNVAGDIGIGGYKNPLGSPDKNDERLFFSGSFIDDGNSFVISKGANRMWQSSILYPMGSPSGSDVQCNVWQSNVNDNCILCNENKFRPCTEYRCKSLGKSCNYALQNGIGFCSASILPAVDNRKIKFLDEGWLQIPNSAWGNVIHRITQEEIASYAPIRITFETPSPSRCAVALTDYSALTQKVDHNFMWINPTEYKTSYNFEVRLPSLSVPGLIKVVDNRVVAITRCFDEQAKQIGKDILTEFIIKEEIKTMPIILSTHLQGLTPTDEGLVLGIEVITGVPFDGCYYSLTPNSPMMDRVSLDCPPSGIQIYNFETQNVGYFACDGRILSQGEDKVYIFCAKDGLWSPEVEVEI